MSTKHATATQQLLHSMTRLSYLPRTLSLVWSAAPKWTSVWIVLLLIQGLLPAAIIYMSKLLIDSLASVLSLTSGAANLAPTLSSLAAVAALTIIAEALQSVTDWVRASQAEFIEDHIKALLHAKSISVDLAFYESSEYHDRLDQARSEASDRSRAILENIGSLLQNGIALLAMAAILLPYGLWLPIVLLLSTLPAFVVVVRFNRRYHKWWQRTTTTRRWIWYYDALLTGSSVAAELRLYGLGEHFQASYQALRRRLRSERLQQMKLLTFRRMGAGFSALLVTALALVWMVLQAGLGKVSLGDLALFYQAFQRGQGVMQSLLASLGQIYANSLFLENLFAFLDLEPQIVAPSAPTPPPARLEQGIRFRDVTFRYPGSGQPALQSFDLDIPAGKIVALVGPNGAGKSTLVKLLCRFYDPQDGAVEVDGIDVRDLDVRDLRDLITVLFQSAQQYQFTAAQNIQLGDLAGPRCESHLEGAARAAGAHNLIASLPDGYDTQLGRWFPGGAELSGGEWQRIAMARAFLRQAPIIILDEPTSAMDSWAEADWFSRFRNLAQDRTALVITHRFTIAMRADIIHVMDRGQIVESGSHEELLAQGGLYAKSWSEQMKASGHDQRDAYVHGTQNSYAVGVAD